MKSSSLFGDESLVFDGLVGHTYQSEKFPKQNYIVDSTKYDSEGNWAFCRSAKDSLDIELTDGDTPIFSIRGWPKSEWHFQSIEGDAIPYYSFGIYLDTQHSGIFLPNAVMYDLKFDMHNIPKSWRFTWSDHDYHI